MLLAKMALDPRIKMQYSASHRGFNRYHYYDKYMERHLKPWEYLDAIGVDKLAELLIDGFSMPWICQEIGLAQIIVLKWIDADPARSNTIEWARRNVSDNWVYEGKELLDNAPLVPEAISKADKQANYRLKMATGFGAERWGKKINVDAKITQATISYVINAPMAPQPKAINGEAKRIEQNPVDLDTLELTALLSVDDEEKEQENQSEEAA